MAVFSIERLRGLEKVSFPNSAWNPGPNPMSGIHLLPAFLIHILGSNSVS